MSDAQEQVQELARALRDADGSAVALTGAGVSTASGIPAFRGEDGIWSRYDPHQHGHIDALHVQPEKVWEMLRELHGAFEQASPSQAHQALAELEELGLLRAVITQNVDGLHQRAGNSRVIELHGSARTLSCMECGESRERDEFDGLLEDEDVPSCPECGGVLRPDVVFFGEELPEGVYGEAEEEARDCHVFLVVGTAAEVEPAASLPDTARENGAAVWEINPDPSYVTSRVIELPAEEALPALVEALRRQD